METLTRYGGGMMHLSLDRYLDFDPPGVLLHDAARDPLIDYRRQPTDVIRMIAPEPRRLPSGMQCLFADASSFTVLPIVPVYSPTPQQMMLGRDNQCDLMISDATVSRYHARIVRQNGLHLIKDLGSTAGTRINGQRIPSFEERILESGDRLTVGWVTLTFLEPQDLYDLVVRLLRRPA